MTDNKLEKLRQKINDVDDKILDLLAQRAVVVSELVNTKILLIQ